MRYGTRTIVGKKWTACGHRPEMPMKYGYQYSYLYQAIQPATGESFEMFLPNMSGECFEIFIHEFSKEYPNNHLIMDNAGSHHTDFKRPKTGAPILHYLPAYSPDFNPQERVFQEIKRPLKGRFFETIEPIEQQIEAKIKELKQNQGQAIQQLTQWDWIVP